MTRNEELRLRRRQVEDMAELIKEQNLAIKALKLDLRYRFVAGRNIPVFLFGLAVGLLF